MDETQEDDQLNKRTISFLRTAADLSATRNLTADLRTCARLYGDSGRVAGSKARSCPQCSMRLEIDEILVCHRKPNHRRPRLIILRCRFCTHELVRSPLQRREQKSRDQSDWTESAKTKVPDVRSQKKRLLRDQKITPESSISARRQSSSVAHRSDERNKKGKANTLRKLAALAANETAKGGSSPSGFSLLSFMNSLKR